MNSSNRRQQINKINKNYIEHIKEFIINKDYDNDEKISKIKEIFNVIEQECSVLYYSEITNIIYSKERDDYSEISLMFSDEAKIYISEKDMSEEQKSNILKVVEHIKLAITQKQCLYIQQQARIDELNNTTNIINDEYKNLKESYNELKRKYENIMISFVSILGIFASIIFAVFGGFKQLEGLGNNLHHIAIYKMLMYIGCTGIVITSIVFISFYSVSKLTGLRLHSCGCASKCECSVYKKYPVLMITYHFLISMISTGFIILLLRHYYDFGLTNNAWIGGILILIFSILLILPVLIFLYNNFFKSKKEK